MLQHDSQGGLGSDVRAAKTEAELNAIYAFRYRVYCQDDGRERPGLDHVRREMREELDDVRAVQLYQADASGIVGTVRLTMIATRPLPDYLSAWLGLSVFREKWGLSALAYCSRLMVDPQRRHTRLGLSLLMAAYRTLRNHDIRFAFMYCKPSLVPLYMHAGFRQHAAAFVHPTSGENVPLVIVLGDTAYLERIGSPFSTMDGDWSTDEEAAMWMESQLQASGRYQLNRWSRPA